jgi:YidC/Oxa1 family membrane protein insertase
MQMVGKVMPIFFGFISWTLPTGLVVYFLTGNIFRIGQQALIVKLDDREEVKKEEKKEENNEDSQSNPIQEDPRKNRKKRRRK